MTILGESRKCHSFILRGSSIVIDTVSGVQRSIVKSWIPNSISGAVRAAKMLEVNADHGVITRSLYRTNVGPLPRV